MSLKSKIEAIIYAAEEPVTLDQITELVAAETGEEPKRAVKATIDELIEDYAREDRGMEIRHVASGFRMATKPEHHDAVRAFAKSLKPPIRLSLPALETLAVIAYKQPVTAPEIGEIRGVDASGVLGTLIDRKLITTAGRKDVIGRPILYKTTKEFLQQFGQQYGRPHVEMTEDALAALKQYHWPGNVRELRNLVERVIILNPKTLRIERKHLPMLVYRGPVKPTEGRANARGEEFSSLLEAREAYERDYILKKLDENHGNVSRTAEGLGLERSHLYRKMKALGVSVKE